MPTSSLILSFLFLWNVSRSQSCAVSEEELRAYLPEACTEMVCIAVLCPFIKDTSSLVSRVNKHTNSILLSWEIPVSYIKYTKRQID